jgi:hypothetical protein
MALRLDLNHGNTGRKCYDIWVSKRFLWFFWTPYFDANKFVFAPNQEEAWTKACSEIYGTSFYYGPNGEK